MKPSENHLFNKFWSGQAGQELGSYVRSSCIVENNDELADALLTIMYNKGVRTTAEAKVFLSRCQKSIQRILATV